MDMELTNNIIYANNLDTARFARMFNTTAQSYKFYWLEAILNLLASHEGDIVFEEIVDEMICEAWHTVTHFHLHLGPLINGNAENFLEHAINTLNVVVNITNRPSRDELLAAIREADAQIRADKLSLVNLVPYRLLYPFLNVQGMEEGFEYLKNNSRTRLIAYLEKIQGSEKFLYTFVDGVGLNKKIRMNPVNVNIFLYKKWNIFLYNLSRYASAF